MGTPATQEDDGGLARDVSRSRVETEHSGLSVRHGESRKTQQRRLRGIGRSLRATIEAS